MVGPPETLTWLSFKAGDGPGGKPAVFAHPTEGYAGGMTDAEKPSPPGSPMRQDEAGGGRPEGHDDDASASSAANESAEEAGGHKIPIDDEQPDPGSEPGEDEDLQEENAETSLDQPSQ
jgi:hypothetical protein